MVIKNTKSPLDLNKEKASMSYIINNISEARVMINETTYVPQTQ